MLRLSRREWQMLRVAGEVALRDQFLHRDLASLPKPENVSTAVMALSVLHDLGDRIGSDSRYFSPQTDMSLDAYVRHSKRRAQQALKASGLLVDAASTAPLTFASSVRRCVAAAAAAACYRFNPAPPAPAAMPGDHRGANRRGQNRGRTGPGSQAGPGQPGRRVLLRTSYNGDQQPDVWPFTNTPAVTARCCGADPARPWPVVSRRRRLRIEPLGNGGANEKGIVCKFGTVV